MWYSSEKTGKSKKVGTGGIFHFTSEELWYSLYVLPLENVHGNLTSVGMVLRSVEGSWRDGLAVNSTDRSSRGPEFKSQQPHGGSQPSVMRSNALFW